MGNNTVRINWKWVLLALSLAMITMIGAARIAFGKTMEPATVTVIGTPSSKIAECKSQERFAGQVLKAKAQGIAKAEVIKAAQDAVLEQHVDADLQKIAELIDELWSIDFPADQVAQAVYRVCLKS